MIEYHVCKVSPTPEMIEIIKKRYKPNKNLNFSSYIYASLKNSLVVYKNHSSSTWILTVILRVEMRDYKLLSECDFINFLVVLDKLSL